MAWKVLFDDDFAEWLFALEPGVTDAILSHVEVLRERGPRLGRPFADTVEGSAFSNLKELRVQFRGDPWRILFAFDPERVAILLVGGNKRGEKRWYKTQIPIADERFQRHLDQLTE
jgi:hypothetical protein